MKNQDNMENKINTIVYKFNSEIAKLSDIINDLTEQNKYLTGKLSNNQLCIHELRKEITNLYLTKNNMNIDKEYYSYIN